MSRETLRGEYEREKFSSTLPSGFHVKQPKTLFAVRRFDVAWPTTPTTSEKTSG